MTKHRPGRPPVDRDDPSVPVHVCIPSRRYDALYARARAERVTVPELIRRSLANKKTENRKTG